MTNLTLEGQILSSEFSLGAPIYKLFKPREVKRGLLSLQYILEARIAREMAREDLLYMLTGTFFLRIELKEFGIVNNNYGTNLGLVFEDAVEIDMKTLVSEAPSTTFTADGWIPKWRYEHYIYCPEKTLPHIIGIGTITISDD